MPVSRRISNSRTIELSTGTKPLNSLIITSLFDHQLTQVDVSRYIEKEIILFWTIFFFKLQVNKKKSIKEKPYAVDQIRKKVRVPSVYYSQLLYASP